MSNRVSIYEQGRWRLVEEQHSAPMETWQERWERLTGVRPSGPLKLDTEIKCHYAAEQHRYPQI